MKKNCKLLVIIGLFFVSNQCIKHDYNKIDAYSVNECTVSAYQNIKGFYHEKKNTMNLLVFGDSNSLRAVNPLLIWENTKLTSYNLSSSSQTSWLAEYLFTDALRTQRPKLIILDASLFFADPNGKLDRNCRTVNAILPGETRINAMKYLLDQTNYTDDSTRAKLADAYTRDVVKSVIIEKMKQTEYITQTTHGYVMNTSSQPYTGGDYMANNTRVSSLIYENVTHIKSIMRIAEQHDIKVLMIRVPGALEWSNSRSELVRQFALQNGVPYMDMNIEPYISQIDWINDTRDQGLHMNANGAEKVSNMLSEYLYQNYSWQHIEDQSIHNQYQNDLQRYREVKNEYEIKGSQKDFS